VHADFKCIDFLAGNDNADIVSRSEWEDKAILIDWFWGNTTFKLISDIEFHPLAHY
jgi:hypothetical protein